eukprot:10057405-Heterocapsa_arctica.AAC.1
MGHAYRGRLFRWGQPVLARKPVALEQAKFEARWISGIWTGRQPEADDHLVAVGHNRIICTCSYKVLFPTVEP